MTAAGLYYAGAEVNWWYAIWATIGIVLFHATGNAWSDWFDFRKGVDREDTKGSTVITSGAITPKEDLMLAIVLLVLSLANGVAMLLVIDRPLPLLYVGVAGAILAIGYPWTKYHAMGDLNILFTYGILPALGTGYISTGCWTWEALWYTPAFVTITVAVLHANNTRDIEPDGRAGITTFAMLIGRKASAILYYLEVWLPAVWTLVLICLGRMPWLCILILASFRMIADNCRQMYHLKDDPHAIDNLDERTSMQQMLSSGILILSMVIMRLASEVHLG